MRSSPATKARRIRRRTRRSSERATRDTGKHCESYLTRQTNTNKIDEQRRREELLRYRHR
nr:MAG TPA: hypothetical protein [Caudoviricetes sp.]